MHQQLLRLSAVRSDEPPRTVYEHWHKVAPVWPVQRGAGNAVKLTQGQGTDVTTEETHDELWIRAHAWADEPAREPALSVPIKWLPHG
jgi:hypothetical protein